MTPLRLLVHMPVAHALGGALLHSLWQGAVLALLLALVLYGLRAATARYLAACVAMLALLAAFAGTFAALLARQGAISPSTAVRTVTVAPADPGDARPAVRVEQSKLAETLPWLALFWVVGVGLCQMRNLASWAAARRLCRTGVCSPPPVWQSRLDQLALRLRLSRPVILLQSCLTEVPVVIGYVRPVILVPVGLLAGLPVAQVEAILLHELAHIRRSDFLVNLLQKCAEATLFYHPAAWWISAVIRAERENCCDDLVVATHGNAQEYALALAALEQHRGLVGEPALAATGGALVKRIRRLLDHAEGPRPTVAPVFFASVLTVAAALVLVAWQPQPAAGPAPGSPFSNWLNQDVAYIITDRERAAFNLLQTDPEREQFVAQFWLRRDPTPATVENEFKQEHYRRISYASERFSAAGVAGWKTDRGRIYIIWGPPDEIESHPSGSPFPFEQWRYRNITGPGSDIIVTFVDPDRSGEYRMTTDLDAKPPVPYVPGQSGGRVFLSAGSGSHASVEITPERKMMVSIPLDFDARQYLVIGTVGNSDGATDLGRFLTIRSLCKHAPEAFACLDRPVFQSGLPMMANKPLPPGAYRFVATVRDTQGSIEKTYRVDFTVE